MLKKIITLLKRFIFSIVLSTVLKYLFFDLIRLVNLIWFKEGTKNLTLFGYSFINVISKNNQYLNHKEVFTHTTEKQNLEITLIIFLICIFIFYIFDLVSLWKKRNKTWNQKTKQH